MGPVTWLLSHLHGSRVVLDVGCGTGLRTAAQLTAAGCTVVGVDPSAELIGQARENVPAASFAQRDLNDLANLHPTGGRFDAAVSFLPFAVLPHSEIGKVLDAIHGVLAPEALLAIGAIPLNMIFPSQLRDRLSHHGFTTIDLYVAHDQHFAHCHVTPMM